MLKATAKHCQFLLTEGNVIRKKYSFLIVNKRAKVMCEFILVQSQLLNFFSFADTRSNNK